MTFPKTKPNDRRVLELMENMGHDPVYLARCYVTLKQDFDALLDRVIALEKHQNRQPGGKVGS